MTERRPLTLALTALAGLAFAAASPALAAKKHKAKSGYRTITVQSNYTTETVTGRVRTTRSGPQVQLPSGAWIPCYLGCAYTLRTQSIDFWKWIQENAGDRG